MKLHKQLITASSLALLMMPLGQSFAQSNETPREWLQMNMLGHDFFIFTDAETMEISIVYRRKDGRYGLIETSKL